MKFELTILGSGAAIPTLRRNATAQFINCNERYILIDCAEGTQAQMRKFKIKFQKIQIILISHLHGDHFFGLAGLLSSMNLMKRTQKMLIYGPVGLEQLVLPLIKAGGHALSYEIEFIEIKHPSNLLLFEDKLLKIHTFPLKHRIPTQGFVIEEKERPKTLNKEFFDELGLSISQIPAIKNGEDIQLPNGELISNEDLTFPSSPTKKYAYCSDTKYTESIVPFIENADLLYHEATFTEKLADRAQTTFHSTAKQAALIAHQAKVNKLLLGHFSSRYDDVEEHLEEAKAVFENTVCVEDGAVYAV